MHPWNHLKAALFLLERVRARDLRGPGRSASYILDLSELNFKANVSASADNTPEGKRKAPAQKNRAQLGAGKDAPKWLIDKHGELSPGMSVLKVALEMVSAHFPETLKKVYFWNSDSLFLIAFKVFSLWVDARTRSKFVFIGNGWLDSKPAKLLESFDPSVLPREFGGLGESLEGDGFIQRFLDEKQQVWGLGDKGSLRDKTALTNFQNSALGP
eukprot:CAMPEP_0184313074 /NCGR_PEP_ID=MMETSP1049-20130417/58815_1 /TAXON_ID=77928 /ORGANISM="Proteomonas sulcata, Strain CCMP704" /LENGTH=213 /DNA_ID=CAMNT_0026629935 /DNA_START=90 /DNA_END=728 /DNA_ORIENTATION=-